MTSLQLIEKWNYNDLPADTQAKDCIKCHWEQLLEAFPVNARTKDGRGATCRICLKDIYLQQKYGITIEDYNEQLEAQKGRCFKCGQKPLPNKALNVCKQAEPLCLQLIHDTCPAA